MNVGLGARVEALAAAVGGRVGSATAWFDGFWDFFVEHRTELEKARSIQGYDRWQGPYPGADWAIIFRPPSRVTADGLRIDLFVEAKGRRAGGAWDGSDRPFPIELGKQLRGIGFEPVVSYWGLRASRCIDPEHSIDDLFERMPLALDTARRLARSLMEDEAR